MAVAIHVGTSGWQYRDWKERFYPKEVPQREWLEYFSARFPVVEVNNTFYMLPKEETFDRWREGSADGFRFVVKANRFITHLKRLRDPDDPLERFWSRAVRLRPKLGPVLFQLPPNFPADHERLDSFLRALPRDMEAAFEFRHPTWETGETYRLLDQAGCAWVLADRPGWWVDEVVTGGWSYVRFHHGRRTGPGYARTKLRRWAGRLAGMKADDVYVFFNNDPTGAAIRDAYALTGLLAEEGADVRGPVRDR
ncbi:MAG: DUF72 domain-containing protein [Actinomycetota bacterium]|nr:DUF72 domain-containing protein [Actinomycetota bacterium]